MNTAKSFVPDRKTSPIETRLRYLQTFPIIVEKQLDGEWRVIGRLTEFGDPERLCTACGEGVYRVHRGPISESIRIIAEDENEEAWIKWCLLDLLEAAS